MTPTIEFIRQHRSIRQFTDAPVPEEDIIRAVEAGQAASTSSAVQAYSMLQITDPEVRARLAELTGPQEKVAASGAFFVVCGDVRRHRLLAERAGHPYDARLEAFLVAAIDASLFAQNVSLAFESLGYGICYIGGLRNALDDVDAILQCPFGVYPLFGLCVGVPAEDPVPRPRLPVEAVLFQDRFPDDDDVLEQIRAYDSVYAKYLGGRDGTPAPNALTWSDRIAQKAGAAVREDIAAYYTRKGARLD
ncbi:MAG: NADPH-dependent oxidoreductase [Phycisphaerales bacterium]|nr:NADPH-dependent oxidoreductase [Phycisphaerales bacterium]